MAASTGMHGYGTLLFVGDFGTANPNGIAIPAAGDGDWARLDEIISINGIGMNYTVTEVTHLTSDDFAKEKIPGFCDAGQVTFRMNYSTALLAEIHALLPPPGRFGTGVTSGHKAWVVQFPDGGQWYFSGFIQGLPFTVEEDNRVTVEVTVEITGIATFNT